MKKIFIDLKLRLGYIVRGIKTRKNFHLMDRVTYGKKVYFINNMVSSCGQCRTRLIDIVEAVPYEQNPNRDIDHVSEAMLKKVKCWENFKRGIFSIYDFQMLYWHRANVRELVEKKELTSKRVLGKLW